MVMCISGDSYWPVLLLQLLLGFGFWDSLSKWLIDGGYRKFATISCLVLLIRNVDRFLWVGVMVVEFMIAMPESSRTEIYSHLMRKSSGLFLKQATVVMGVKLKIC